MAEPSLGVCKGTLALGREEGDIHGWNEAVSLRPEETPPPCLWMGLHTLVSPFVCFHIATDIFELSPPDSLLNTQPNSVNEGWRKSVFHHEPLEQRTAVYEKTNFEESFVSQPHDVSSTD